jgi:hypothetical protein
MSFDAWALRAAPDGQAAVAPLRAG